MKILAIETSCDETSASVAEKKTASQKITVLSNITASSIAMHAKTGGIIPEKAAREQLKYILTVITDSLLSLHPEKRSLPDKEKFTSANEILKKEIDAIALTVGPGLLGTLLVGIETAKTIAYTLNKPIIPVNHLLAHIYANFILDTKYQIQNTNISFPFIGLIVSGGHTDLLLFKSHNKYKWLGGTRDDAAGEAFDKIARILNIGYPGGPIIEKRARLATCLTESRRAKRAKKGKKDERFNFKSPMIESKDFDFSFSGLKTQVAREINKYGRLNNQEINNVCFAVQKAIVKVLVKKTILAAEKFKVPTIVLGGGVSANGFLREQMQLNAERYLLDAEVFYPDLKYTTDNAAMTGAYALLSGKPADWKKITAQPELYFE